MFINTMNQTKIQHSSFDSPWYYTGGSNYRETIAELLSTLHTKVIKGGGIIKRSGKDANVYAFNLLITDHWLAQQPQHAIIWTCFSIYYLAKWVDGTFRFRGGCYSLRKK